MIGLTFHDDVKGATFSEVMVAMALVSVGVMGAMGALEAADRSLARDALAVRALSMAESRVEAKRAAPWGQLLAEDLDHDGVPDLTMHDDGTGGDRMAGDGIYSAMLEQHG
ncbi:MAG TPA: choice-of-anchor X domain-containing protein, partial [Nitrospira sp.]|nr:choice-of-anchor X domain-containing protein [Nitrospira sp.]